MGIHESKEALNDYLESVGSETARTHAATALAQGLLVGKGRGAVTAWRKAIQESNPALSQALFIGEIEVMAALNPRTAAAIILEQPRSSDRDQAIEALLRRTTHRDEAVSSWVVELWRIP